MADFTPIAYKISNSDYSYILENITFRLGDSLVFASGIEIHLINSDFTDSIIELQGINSNGIEGVIRLTIPSLEIDSQIETIEDFNNIFGSGSLTYDPVITSVVPQDNQIYLEGTVGPGIQEVIIYAQSGSAPDIKLGKTDVINGFWQYIVENLDGGKYTFYASGVLTNGLEGSQSDIESVYISDEFIVTSDLQTIFESPEEPSTVVFTLQGNSNSLVDVNLASGSQVDFNELQFYGLDENNQLRLNTEGQATFSLSVLSDLLPEGTELLQLAITEHLSEGRSRTTQNDIQVLDVLPAFTIETNYSEVYEQPENPNVLTYAINGAAGSTVTLNLASDSVANLDDIASTSLPPNSNTLTLDNNGQTSFNVTILKDLIVEGDETLNLIATETLIDGTRRSTNTSVLIHDSLPGLTLSSNLSSVYEQPGSPNTLTYTVNGAAGSIVTLNLASDSVADLNDIASTSLPPNSNTLTLDNNGQVSFNVTILKDLIVEGDETLNLIATETLSDGTHRSTNASVLIHDTLPGLTLNSNLSAVYEQPGSPNTLTYTLNGAAGSTVTLNLASDSVANLDDIASTSLPPNSNTLRLDNNGQASFNVTILKDLIVEGDETLNLIATETLIDGTRRSTNASVLIHDTLPGLTLNSNLSAVYEQPGSPNTLTYTVNGAAGSIVTLNFAPDSIADSSDIASTSLPPNSNTLTLDSNGQALFSVTVIEDLIVEGDETLNLIAMETLSDGTQRSVNSSIVIHDTLPDLVLSHDLDTIFESPDIENTITYTIQGAANSQVTLDFSSDTEANSSDIESSSLPPNSNLIVLNEQGRGSFTVTAKQDLLAEGDEWLRIIATETLTDGTQRETQDDVLLGDTLPDLIVGSDLTEIREIPGSPSVVTYEISGTAGGVVYLDFASTTVADTNDISSDFFPTSTNPIILDSNGKASFTVTALADSLLEGNEGLSIIATEEIAVGSPRNYGIDVLILDSTSLPTTPPIDTPVNLASTSIVDTIGIANILESPNLLG